MSIELLLALLGEIRLIGADSGGLRRVHARPGANAPLAIATLQHWHVIASCSSRCASSRCAACGRPCSRASSPSPGPSDTTPASHTCHSGAPNASLSIVPASYSPPHHAIQPTPRAHPPRVVAVEWRHEHRLAAHADVAPRTREAPRVPADRADQAPTVKHRVTPSDSKPYTSCPTLR